MRITIERASFLKALTHVQSVVERRNTIPILSNVLMSAQGDTLKLTATDLDIEISESGEGVINERIAWQDKGGFGRSGDGGVGRRAGWFD